MEEDRANTSQEANNSVEVLFSLSPEGANLHHREYASKRKSTLIDNNPIMDSDQSYAFREDGSDCYYPNTS